MTTGSALDAVRVAVGADLALLLVTTPVADRLRVLDRCGTPVEHLPDEVTASAGSSLARVLAGTLPGRLPRLALVSAARSGRSRRLGPAIVVPAIHPVLGDIVVVLARRPPRRPFDDSELSRVRELMAARRNGTPPRGAQRPVPAWAVAADPGAAVRAAGRRTVVRRLGPGPYLPVPGEEALAAAFDRAPAGMSLVDEDLRYRWVNVALCALLGRSRRELLGMAVPDVVHPSHTGRARAFHDRLRVGDGAAVRDRFGFCGRDGDRVWMDVGASLFSSGEERLFLVQQFDVTEHQDRAEELAHRAVHDDLTGLANRALLRERVRTVLSRRSHPRVVAFYLDIDRFKQINDEHGHTAGDIVLREVARRLAGVVRDGDTVARVGGDEFVVAGEVADVAEATRIAERIGAALLPSIDVRGRLIRASVSVGVALSAIDDRPEDLIDRADQALLTAKRGRTRSAAPA